MTATIRSTGSDAAGAAARAAAVPDADPEVDRLRYWARQARSRLDWSTDFHTTLQWDEPFAEWFVGGRLNASVNCLDRHVAAGLGDRVAYHWEGEPGDRRTITYAELLAEVERAAAMLASLGVRAGDRVAIYLPMVPELPVSMLACARIGAAHSVVFGGFSAHSLADRIVDAGARVLITADGGYRKGKVVPLKGIADEAVDAADAAGAPVDRVVVVPRLHRGRHETPMTDGRDLWWGDAVDAAGPPSGPAALDAEQLLFLLYTSGTTGSPKGIMHTTGGYLTQVATTMADVFDLRPDTDVYWCTADIGWITGHSYVVYGPLLNGATSVIYEGTPDFPDNERFWSIVERYGVSVLYTAPTAIRLFMRWGAELPARHDLSSIRVLGSVGEIINPEAWRWYQQHIGGGHAPVIDTWWQTETGGVMVSPVPATPGLKPGSASRPRPGIEVEVVDDHGDPITEGTGYLTVAGPWPSMLRGIWGDPDRYRETYWSRFPGRYFAGDGCRIDEDGDLWLLGRVDDVMNVSGHRISTAEVESALIEHDAVAEAAVVGADDELTGQAIVCFVTVRDGAEASDDLGQELRTHTASVIGPTARPREVRFVGEMPKTRSGKIMRRLLRDVVDGRDPGDATTLADPSVLDSLRT
jgi:acetyl-CoA synthetase